MNSTNSQSDTKSTHKNILRIYLKEISQFPTLTQEEEKKLVKRIEKGDEEARKELIYAHLKLVVSIAKKYAKYDVHILDLIEEGNLGLIQAVERFKYRKRCRFSTYSSWWIKQAILNFLTQYLKVSAELVFKLGREPTIEEIAKKMKLPYEKVERIISLSEKPISLEESSEEEDGIQLVDKIEDSSAVSPAKEFFKRIKKQKINELLNLLPKKERDVIVLRYGLDGKKPRTLEEISKLFNVTKERIRQIEMKVLRRLRWKILHDNKLKILLKESEI
jgi:RNA polymerase primary sigma factor